MSAWKISTLGDYATVQTGPFGSQLHAADYLRAGVPVVMPQDLGDNTISTGQIARVGESDAERLGRHRLRPGDIVFSRRGDVTRRSLVRSENDGWLCGTGCLRVKPHATADGRFLSYALGASETQEWLIAHAVGATMPNLNTEILGRVPLQIPPLVEQRAIAEVLGALDDKIACNAKIVDHADDLAHQIYQAGTCSFPRAPMNDLLTPILGGTPSRARSDYWGGDALWVSVRDISRAPRGVVLATEETMTRLAATSTKARPLPIGSVLMSARGTVGSVARLAKAASFNQSSYGFVPDRWPASLLYFLIRDASERVGDLAHGSVFDTVTKSTFDHIEIPHLPQLAAFELASKLTPLLDIVTTVLLENRALVSLRDALVPPLMSGKLRVRDAERTLIEVL